MSPEECAKREVLAAAASTTDAAPKESLVAHKAAKPKNNLLPANQLCQQAALPGDKPKQKIVFPQILRAAEGKLASLWVMLNEEDILTRMSSIRYNQFC